MAKSTVKPQFTVWGRVALAVGTLGLAGVLVSTGVAGVTLTRGHNGAAHAAGGTARAAGAANTAPGKSLRIVATTPIIADLVHEVAGESATITTLIPAGKDPHTFEPSLRTMRAAAHADIAFANGLLLEPQGLMNTLAMTSSGPIVELADHATAFGAKLVPLVENVALDAVWLGLRVQGSNNSNSPTEISLLDAQGPGNVAAFVISTFGTPQLLFNSADGLPDTTRLPANAHTHVSWAFSQPGTYELTFGSPGLAPTRVTVAVGVNPPADKHVIDSGHIDITAATNVGIVLRDGDQQFTPADTVIAVPSSVVHVIPPEPTYRFLGRPGEETYLLPQAVLGAHIHGEVDPHLWHNVANAKAYVDVIAEELTKADPSKGAQYRERAAAYKERLNTVDAQVTQLIGSIPPGHRHLVTTHHGYAYLEQGYGLKISGFVTPNPAIEASPRDVIALRRSLENLQIPAVFVEPNPSSGVSTLLDAARATGVSTCTIRGDTLDEQAPTYIDLMLSNAHELARCLGPGKES